MAINSRLAGAREEKDLEEDGSSAAAQLWQLDLIDCFSKPRGRW
jgi:hypothetical protein